jgi:geranylgeranyl diphosphate synthase type II
MFDLNSYIKEKQTLVNVELDRFLSTKEGTPPTVIQAMRYCIEAGGKRLRPVLCLATCELVGGRESDALHAACALELIHTYSLVHDDLPAMDNDDLRRGKPTCHKAFGEATAILTGDALLTAAFEILASRAKERGSASTTLAAVSLIARAAGVSGMVQGQMMDLFFEEKSVSWNQLELLHSRKTGALIEASVKAGALLGGGSDDEIDAVSTYGRHIGLAFQIADDILDASGDPKLLGKPVGSDKASGKATAVSTLGPEGARQQSAALLDLALEALTPFGDRAEALAGLARFVVERRY